MQGLNYLHRGIVLSLDILCSVFAGIIAHLAMVVFYGRDLIPVNVLFVTLSTLLASTLVFFFFRFYKIIIRHANLQMLPRIIGAVLIIAVVLFGIERFCTNRVLLSGLAALLYFFFACALIIGMRIAMITTYYFAVRISEKSKHANHTQKVFIYGHMMDSAAFAEYLNTAHIGKYIPAAFIDTNIEQTGTLINGLRVYGKNEMQKLEEDIAMKIPHAVIFMGSLRRQSAEQAQIIEWCSNAGVQLYKVPSMSAYDPDAPVNIKPVQIEDLLERDEITIEEDKIAAQLTGKTIMVTGAAGSIGSEIVRQCCRFAPAKMIILDCAESPLHIIRLEIEENFPSIPLIPAIADVRNIDRCRDIVAAHRPDVIFHAAAYKHVPLMEESPCEAVVTNIMGSINMANLAHEHEVDTFVMVSTDKAVNPTNVMGSTKRAAEMYVQSLNSALKRQGKKTRYITTRFGNVLGSNGSVIPRFREQIEKGGPVTVTHPDIIRFFMTIPEACRLVLQAGTMGTGGEIFVFDMGEPVKIAHLARRMIALSGFKPDVDIKIEYTGLRPGEKLYEEVLSSTESTTETPHQKIRTAKAIDNSFEEIKTQTDSIITAALNRQMEQTVITLKALIPEFKSKNSPWEKFDK